MEALKFAKDLLKTGPASSVNNSLGETLNDICTGKVAMAALWSSFAYSAIDPAACQYSDKISYTVFPGQQV